MGWGWQDKWRLMECVVHLDNWWSRDQRVWFEQKPRTKTRAGIFTTAELAFARFDLPIKAVIQNVINKYCFRGRHKTAIMANGNCTQKLVFDLATLSLFTPFIKSKSVLNPLNAVVNWYDPAWLEPAFHFNFGTTQQSSPPLLTENKEWKKSIRYKIWEPKQFTLITIIRFFLHWPNINFFSSSQLSNSLLVMWLSQTNFSC